MSTLLASSTVSNWTTATHSQAADDGFLPKQLEAVHVKLTTKHTVK